jgi:hypothetical protein
LDIPNRRARFAGIPLIVLDSVDPAALAAIAVLHASITAVVLAALYGLALHLPWEVFVGVLIFGWGFQLVGHRFDFVGSKRKLFESLTIAKRSISFANIVTAW